jgi:flap endonuclease-1
MDTLTFGTPILLKHLTFSEAKKIPVHEVNLKKALEGLKMDMDQVSGESSVPFLLHQNDGS